MKKQRYVKPGERVLVECPHSEVCMHMRVAGTAMLAELKESSAWGYSVQLYRPDGTPFSFPILKGEAGFYADEVGVYCYEHEGTA